MDVKKKHLHLPESNFDPEGFEEIMNVKADPYEQNTLGKHPAGTDFRAGLPPPD